MSSVTAGFPAKLAPLFKPSRYKVLHGGRGGGKSWAIARALLIRGVTESIRVLCCREYQKSIKDSVLTLLADQIDELGLDGEYKVLHNEIRGVNNDTQFNFEGLSQNVKGIKSYEGVDICWPEEADGISKRSWSVLIPTIRKEGSEFWISFNPDFEDDYAYERWVLNEDPSATVIEINWRDNPWFPQVLNEERINLKLRDPDSYDHVWEGKPQKWLEGAIYSTQIRKAYETERVTYVPHDPNARVYTAWDLGRKDDTAIWWFQVIGNEVHIIDSYAVSGASVADLAGQILGRTCKINIIDGEVITEIGDIDLEIEHRTHYEYENHYLPHDAKAKTLAAHGKSTEEQLKTILGWENVEIVPGLSIEDGIMAARTFFDICWFDSDRCEGGLKALRKYRREVQRDQKSLKAKPKHDWTSHFSDAFRYMAIVWELLGSESVEQEDIQTQQDYPFPDEQNNSHWKVAL